MSSSRAQPKGGDAPTCRTEAFRHPRQAALWVHCVTGWSVDDVRWAGVRFQQRLDPLPEAKAIRLVEIQV
jgi:DMSO/TMAO reductase YedYZ molybdopterin-dependent catalytic subunit